MKKRRLNIKTRGRVIPLEIRYWYPKKIPKGDNSSPPRTLINQFLKEMLPNLITEKKIKVLDVGCGSGYLREILTKLGYYGEYIGVDTNKHELFDKKTSENFSSRFILDKIEEFESKDKYDLICSITALEHIEDDFKATSVCSENLQSDGIQIHILPCKWSLFLYPHHGYRYYTLQRLKELFGNDIEVYKIGGFFSFILHFFFIRIPVYTLNTDRLRDHPIYPRSLELCIGLYRFMPFWSPFYIIIVRNT